MEDWVNKIYATQTTDCYSAFKGSEAWTPATTRMGPEDVIPSETSQPQKDKYRTIPLIRGSSRKSDP